MASTYSYSLKFTVEDYDIGCFPEEIQNPENLPVTIRFQSLPATCLEITEDDFVEQVHYDKKIIKNASFSLNELQISDNLEAKISAIMIVGQGEERTLGQHQINEFNGAIQRMVESYEKQLKDRKVFGNNCPNQPTFEIIRKLVPLLDENNFQIGSIHYTVQMMCWAPKVVPNDEKLCVKSPVLATRIIESGEGADNDPISIDGCGQTADSPSDDSNKSHDGGLDSKLADFQKEMYCNDNSFNSCKLPADLVHKDDSDLHDRDIDGCVGITETSSGKKSKLSGSTQKRKHEDDAIGEKMLATCSDDDDSSEDGNSESGTSEVISSEERRRNRNFRYRSKDQIKQVRGTFCQGKAFTNAVADFSSLGRSCLSCSLLHLAASQVTTISSSEAVDQLVIDGLNFDTSLRKLAVRRGKPIENYVNLDDLLNLDGSFRYQDNTFFFEVQDLIGVGFASAGECSVKELAETLEKLDDGSYFVLINERWFSTVKSANGFEIFNCHITAKKPTKEPTANDPAAVIIAKTSRQAARVLRACSFVKTGGYIVTKVNVVYFSH